MCAKHECMIHLSTMWYKDGCMESKSIAVRLPVDVIGKLDKIAEKRFMVRGTMLQMWIRERVETESKVI